MTIIEKLDQAFVDRHLQCREGVARAEFVDPQRTGLYILVSASSPGQGPTSCATRTPPARPATRKSAVPPTSAWPRPASASAT